SIYFRGIYVVNVTRDQRWVGRNSFYVEHGDWFIAVCACLAVLGFSLLAPTKLSDRPSAEVKP
ncbi:MAG TPA: hypothetical protein VII09_08665, partial [Opitutaceae bacterium]